jgi:acyl-CoA synthetase (AMP-forming)/AMP-acid ligase II
MLACFKAGFCIVPINARLHPEEVRYQVEDSGRPGPSPVEPA